MNRVIFLPKRQGETIIPNPSPFNFTSQLAQGETISNATVTASVYTGVDANPSAIISGSATVSGAVVSQKLTAGVTGVIYELLCAAVTSLGQTIQLAGYLAVIPDLP